MWAINWFVYLLDYLTGHLPLVQVLTLIILTLTLVAVAWYAWEARQTRIITGLGVMPVVRVVFNKAPEKVLLRNLGHGLVLKAKLQGFRYRNDRGQVWECTFDPVHMILPQAEGGAYARIQLQHDPAKPVDRLSPYVVPEKAIFGHIYEAVRKERSLVLFLFYADALGNCYRVKVDISAECLGRFLAQRDEQPKMSEPKRIVFFPKRVKPVEAR